MGRHRWGWGAFRAWAALIWWEHVRHEHKPGIEGWEWICRRCMRDMPR